MITAKSALPEPILSGMRHEAILEFALGQPMGTNDDRERSLLAFVLPPWQRPEVWEVDRKRRFIEGIFLGLGTGTYVLHQLDWDSEGKPKPMAGWLIDGQQRMSAIRDFVHGGMTIFDGVSYADLDDATRKRRFLRQVFPYHEIKYTPDEARLKTLYERLNFGGIPHTQADLEHLNSTPATAQNTRKGPRP
ncbi:DUF262 domain-containing protein [Hydrogenophaga sp. 2FB]|uniref:DUF262 domain-containing protein n=1 Tax=Hydrogenophaga sp. 2FB TaxID=2502187 RepID=UPI0010F8F171|nr:DUF262 domain-containing protein [Hydrogenophaga sp. 2FB]